MTTDTAPFPYGKLSDARLLYSREFQAYLNWRVCETCPDGECDCPAPAEWLEAAAMEAYVAFTEALDMFVETLIAGRPYDTPLVEWEHRDLDKTQDVAGLLAEMGQTHRDMAR